MEETIYTKDEQELFDLLKWTIDYMQNFPFINDEDKKTADDYIRAYKDTEELVIKLANKRFEKLNKMEEENNKNLNIYHDVTCPKCNFFTALKPVGQKVNKGGYNCPTFDCPKCGTNFSNNLPILVSEKIRLGEAVIKLMQKDKLPLARIKAFKDSNDNLRVAVKAVEKDNAEALRLHKELAEYVNKNIVELTAYKHRVLTGNNKIELN